MRCKLFRAILGLAARAALPARHLASSSVPLVRMRAQEPLTWILKPAAHAQFRYAHLTAPLERRRRRRCAKRKTLPRHHGRHACRKRRPCRHVCKLKDCFCIGGTYKKVPRACRKSWCKRKKKARWCNKEEDPMPPYRRQ